MDLATEAGRKIKFNDTIEVYYYPENMAQHDHHKNESDDDFEDPNDLTYEESISCNEKISLDDAPQEQTDPSFEEMLFHYLK